MEKAIFKVGGMSCEACVRSVSRALNGVAGVASVSVDLSRELAEVGFDPAKADVQALKEAIRQAGFEAP